MMANSSTSLGRSSEREVGHHENFTSSLGGFSAQADVFPIVLATLIIALNSLVIILVIRHKQLRSTTNYLLCSLALSDLLTGLLSIPLFISCNVIRQITICIIAANVLRFTSISTVLHLISITIDRYLAIMHSLRYYNIVTRYRGRLVICCTWVISISVALVQLAWNNPSTIGNADIDPPDSILRHEFRYDIFNIVVFFGIPLLVMVFVNGKIFYEVLRQSSIIRSNFPGWEKKKPAQHREWKAALTFAVMFVAFIACWCPYFILRFQQNLGDEEMFALTPLMEYVLIYLRFLTSFLNPCIYILGKNDFRSAVKGRNKNRALSLTRTTTTKYTGVKTTPL